VTMLDYEAETREVWQAMLRFADDKPLTEREWLALSLLTLIDRKCLRFSPDNVRIVKNEAERVDNLAFYRSLGEQRMSDAYQSLGISRLR
jgi:hypothetical protein